MIVRFLLSYGYHNMAVLACGYVGLFENGSGLLESSGKKASKNVQE